MVVHVQATAGTKDRSSTYQPNSPRLLRMKTVLGRSHHIAALPTMLNKGSTFDRRHLYHDHRSGLRSLRR